MESSICDWLDRLRIGCNSRYTIECRRQHRLQRNSLCCSKLTWMARHNIASVRDRSEIHGLTSAVLCVNKHAEVKLSMSSAQHCIAELTERDDHTLESILRSEFFKANFDPWEAPNASFGLHLSRYH